ncbi:phosphoribosyltransferase family protein [Oceanobacillus kapialis]|uniref:phosphoribosyltransferase family protein n=1 Tax=Oceanobacillus kapialis TaxID=481353 RepID=UPI00384E6214
MKTYNLHVAGLTRTLPIIRITDNLSIASFVVLGDTALITAASPLLAKKLPEVDVLITAEAKGIPFVHELSKELGMDSYIVARKSVKPYMQDPFVHKVVSITTQKEQTLCLDRKDAEKLQGKRVALIDDVISTGESMRALEELVIQAGADVKARAAILAEGEAADREDIIYLEKLPVFID